MSTNYYLKLKKPVGVEVRYHISKRSGGYKPSFEYCPELDHDMILPNDKLEITSVEDIKKIYDSGKYDIIDEYGEVLSWEQFKEECIDWCPDGKSHYGTSLKVTADSEGHEFIHCWYR